MRRGPRGGRRGGRARQGGGEPAFPRRAVAGGGEARRAGRPPARRARRAAAPVRPRRAARRYGGAAPRPPTPILPPPAGEVSSRVEGLSRPGLLEPIPRTPANRRRSETSRGDRPRISMLTPVPP